MVYSFAGLVIDIRFHHAYGKLQCRKYEYTGTREPDMVIEVDEQMMAAERAYDIYDSEEGILESLAAYREICNRAFAYDCMFMHCSAISYKGNGVLFTAPSGTGKSTHSALWCRHFGEAVQVVNDDKPLLRIMDGSVYVCGTPWDGKHHRSTNIMVPVKAIVVLSQAPNNAIAPATPQQVLYHILNQTIRPEDPALMAKVLDFSEKLLQTVPVYRLECTISDEAVTTAFEALKEHFDED
ncbi:MAG: hypothetical protein IJJ41_06285 [Clostridia bacterium]|nr:hypothetical protein [Clostridia bacterium]